MSVSPNNRLPEVFTNLFRAGFSDSCHSDLRSLGIQEIVVVDPSIEQYADFVAAAADGQFGLHFCSDGLSAVKLARRFRADVWLVTTELPDMSGFDLLPILLEHVHQSGVDPLREGSRISLDEVGTGLHSGVFMVSDLYRLEQEQRALAAGSAGYLVRPITLDLVRALRQPASTADSGGSFASAES